MYTKTKYCCSICNSEYDTEQRAKECDSLPLPKETQHIKVGDTISFTRSIAEEATREIKTYVTSEGKVLAKEVKYNSMKNAHHDLYVVLTKDEQGEYEGLCAMINIAGKDELFMASSPRYKVGFAESMKSTKASISNG